MPEIKYLLPVTSARAWQAAWDSPLTLGWDSGEEDVMERVFNHPVISSLYIC